uniref:Mas-related G-protein coupled receptor member X1-like n=1 Tax=Sparus aurata TaxID=8175 RepID=A0A671X425_SPAAU
MFVVSCIITAIGLLLTLMAICAVCSLVRKDHVVPIYVINLLISDLIQFCCMIPLETKFDEMMTEIVFHIYLISVIVSICFMVCIALERYLVIACPLWYRFRHTIKFSVVLCVMVWVLSPVLCALTLWVPQDDYITYIIMGTFLLLPLPLFIFFLGGTIRALSTSRVPSDEKRRIVGILVLVLLIYTLLFLPSIIWFMAEMYHHHLTHLADVFVQLSPLADSFLYVFMRKGTIDKLLASVCCCRMDSNDSSRMDSSDITSSSV